MKLISNQGIFPFELTNFIKFYQRTEFGLNCKFKLLTDRETLNIFELWNRQTLKKRRLTETEAKKQSAKRLAENFVKLKLGDFSWGELQKLHFLFLKGGTSFLRQNVGGHFYFSWAPTTKGKGLYCNLHLVFFFLRFQLRLIILILISVKFIKLSC